MGEIASKQTTQQKSATKLSWKKIVAMVFGLSALLWFLIRVIPKPSRASYPCQQAAFPLASAFIIWLTGILSSLLFVKYLKNKFRNHRLVTASLTILSTVLLVGWFAFIPTTSNNTFGASAPDTTYVQAKGFDWMPLAINQPVGIAKGIYPGRVVMSRNPEATKWSGHWQTKNDQWWLDKNTDAEKVNQMLSVTIQKLTEAKSDKKAWKKIFNYYNSNSRGLKNRGYIDGEIVAVKINLNNSSDNKTDNQTDATPQMVLAMVRQLIEMAGVPQKNVLVYDARRPMYPAMLTTLWKAFPDIRIMQEKPASKSQPLHPLYKNHDGIESADWVEGIHYSAGNYNKAKLIPKQIMEATYIVNLALLKAHSYPYNYMEDGDEGQTAITMCGKNHAGSIKGTSELHAILNTKKEGVKNAYSPLVDLAASPNLGAKTILFVLDGLYCGRKWRSYPIHFPNPPFNNQVSPYENNQWPACVLSSLDGVALESVGLDILYAQSKNNCEESYHNVPRLLIRENADDFLREMATPDNAPSGTKYVQNNQRVSSLGVHEHWDSDTTMRYSRNIDKELGKGIEFIYIPIN